ncbi:hypothetical protein BD414DRAFT_545513 [Trametes punicea]|nr:hypothetical protein BD414DRAFT_545513 [Trametes punicea]
MHAMLFARVHRDTARINEDGSPPWPAGHGPVTHCLPYPQQNHPHIITSVVTHAVVQAVVQAVGFIARMSSTPPPSSPMSRYGIVRQGSESMTSNVAQVSMPHHGIQPSQDGEGRCDSCHVHAMTQMGYQPTSEDMQFFVPGAHVLQAPLDCPWVMHDPRQYFGMSCCPPIPTPGGIFSHPQAVAGEESAHSESRFWSENIRAANASHSVQALRMHGSTFDASNRINTPGAFVDPPYTTSNLALRAGQVDSGHLYPPAVDVPCWWDCCGRHLHDVTPKGIRSHLKEFHFLERLPSSRKEMVNCKWAGCHRDQMQWENIPKHVAECHFKAMARLCNVCGTTFARSDVLKRHRDSGSCTGDPLSMELRQHVGK